MTEFEFRPTKKGLLRAEFQDRFGATCSVQESSFQDEDCLWLGVEVDIYGNEIAGGRMHMTRETAKRLIPILRYFARTGKLGQEDPSKRFQLGAWVIGVGTDNRDVEGRIVAVDAGGFFVQDQAKAGAQGRMACMWEVADLLWEPMDRPEHIPTRYDRIAGSDGEDSV